MKDTVNLLGAIAALVSAVGAVLAAWHAMQANKRTKAIKVDTKALRSGSNGGPPAIDAAPKNPA